MGRMVTNPAKKIFFKLLLSLSMVVCPPSGSGAGMKKERPL